MHGLFRSLSIVIAAASLLAIDSAALAQPKDKGKDHKEQGAKHDKAKKEHKHHNGKDLLGANIKKDGHHKLHENGKNTAFVDVKGGKIAGVKVKHAEKGDVPVKKYKTTKKMADTSGMQPVSFNLAQSQYLGTTWIGYSYIDEWGDEVIYWFPYEMVYDGDTGAIEYYPA